jgi:DEAD/DEAH box helicase domain-containing protein
MSIPRRKKGEGVRDLADALNTSKLLSGAVEYRRFLPGAPASHRSLAKPFPRQVAAALDRAGAGQLYTHQADALEHVRANENVVVVTPTASGKSFVYMAPTLELCASDPEAHALYIYPYKALAQDQARAFKNLARDPDSTGGPGVAIYDGDTPQKDRRKIRSRPPRVLITNPDMLHLGLLPYHYEWEKFLSRLKLIVVDELHVYRGVFGSHLHHVMTRLRRICARYGSSPIKVACSATIGNPGQFAESLLGEPFNVVERSGAPRAGRHFIFVNSSGSSPYTLATRILAECLKAGWRTITFTKARKVTELIFTWIQESNPEIARKISAYRAGYLPGERRAIERKLGDGSLLGVVTTSALEHGIDIGGLDVCILVGYPGSITSSWQRIGRVGRSDRESLVIMVGLADALDQYFMSNPVEFFERGFEPVAADPHNKTIASQHLICAAAEIPITDRDKKFYEPPTFDLVGELARKGSLVAGHMDDGWYSLRRTPSRDVRLRSIGEGYSIVEEPEGRHVGSVGGVRAFVECHEGAVYLHQGQQYEVTRLDRDRLKVEVRRCNVPFYTQVLSEKETEILQVLDERQESGFVVRLGEVRVTQEFKEYVRKQISDQRKISSHPLDLPPVIYETVGMWIEVPHRLRDSLTEKARHFMGCLHACEHAAISLFPLLTICDGGDLGGISYPNHPQLDGPAVFIYDGYPGGIGLAKQGFEKTRELFSKTALLIESCVCENGCPSCIHSPRCGNGNHPLDKEGSIDLLRGLLSPGKEVPLPRPATIRPAMPPREHPVATAANTVMQPSGAQPNPGDSIAAPVAGRDVPAEAPGEKVLFFDLETCRSAEEVGGWGKIRAMGLALAVVYDNSTQRYRTYKEGDAEKLAIHLLSADLVVGFNVKRFDYEVLRAYTDANFEKVNTLDMLELIHKRLGFRLSLGHLAEATLGAEKGGDGLQSIQWYKDGRMDLIEEYCRKDVELTKGLYDYGREHGFLVYLDRRGRQLRVPTSWFSQGS